jgi:hypothetical protein
MNWKKYTPGTRLKKVGLGLLLYGVFGTLTTILFFVLDFEGASAVFGEVIFALIGGIVMVVGIGAFLLSPASDSYLAIRREREANLVAQRVEAERKVQERELPEIARQIDIELKRLQTSTGVRAVMSFNNLAKLVAKTNQNLSVALDELLKSINFDKSRLESKRLGAIPIAPSGDANDDNRVKYITIYKDWVIADQFGFDFDVSTRGQVIVEGGITFDVMKTKIDTRTATLHLATQDWSHVFRISPNDADEARRILNQLLAIVDEMKPKGVTAAEIKAALTEIIGSAGKSPAEKLEELSNLRYQRLLTDQEFETAKSKILGL